MSDEKDQKPSKWESLKDHVSEAAHDAADGEFKKVFTYEGKNKDGEGSDEQDQGEKAPEQAQQEQAPQSEEPKQDEGQGDEHEETDEHGNKLTRGVKAVGSHVGEGAADFVTGTAKVLGTAAEGVGKVGESAIEGLSDVFHHEGKFEHSGDKDGEFGDKQGDNVDNANAHDTRDDANANKRDDSAKPQDGQDPQSKEATPGGAGQQGQGSDGFVTREQEEAAHQPAESDQHGDPSEGTHPEERADVQEV